MSLTDKLKEATIADLEHITILALANYARKNERIIDFLYDNAIIDDSSIERALEKAVIAQARGDYEIMTREGRPHTVHADHVISGRPDFLAYALQKGAFSDKEIVKIPFDHGDTAETFQRTYGKVNLLSTLREELLHPKKLPPEQTYASHPCAGHDLPCC